MFNRNTSESVCELCGCHGKTTKHHLVPKVKCSGKLSSEKNSESNVIQICDLCHRTLHAYFSENFLRDELNTLEKILKNDHFGEYLKWRGKHRKFQSNSTKMRRS